VWRVVAKLNLDKKAALLTYYSFRECFAMQFSAILSKFRSELDLILLFSFFRAVISVTGKRFEAIVMTLFHIALLALIQGITEFLPISSSAHLVLLPNLTGLADQGQLMDVAVHLGTLVAVVAYFWGDAKRAFSGLAGLILRRAWDENQKLALLLIVATIPAILFGLVLKLTGVDDMLRDSVAVIGWMMLVFGVVLYLADTGRPEEHPAASWTMRHAMILGLWQALALIPGTSRSGITITGARLLGYTRLDAAKLSMLMSIPTIIAAGGLQAMEVASTGQFENLGAAALAAALSCVAAFAALGLMMRLLNSVSYTPYVIYRVIFGAFLIGWAYLG
jgi:undecaprenyl-diphosphatase